GLLVHPVDLELVEPLEVEHDRALLAVDLEPVVVLASALVARRLQGPDGAVIELHHGHERVVHVHLAHALAFEARPMLNERARERTDRLDLPYEMAAQVDD